MNGLRQGTLNLFTAGLFHYLEQALMNLACDGTGLYPPRDSKMEIFSKWYSENWKLHFPYLKGWQAIEEIRLVANTVKHAEGVSAEKLRLYRPDLFCHPILRESDPTQATFPSRVTMPLAGDDIYVTKETFRAFHRGATEFVGALIAHFPQ